MKDIWTISRLISWASEDLKKYSSTSPRLDADLMLGRVLNLDRIKLLMDFNRPLTKCELENYRKFHQRRRTGEPIAYILGEREFYGRKFSVDNRVLVPRPETEILVEITLKRAETFSNLTNILDLCTGSGCVGITLACEQNGCSVTAVDLSKDALDLAFENAVRLNAEKVKFIHSDLFENISKWMRFDIIVSNPPYIADADITSLPVDVKNFEPHLALAGGSFGTDILLRMIDQSPQWLNMDGILAVEIGCEQGSIVEQLFKTKGFEQVEVTQDYAGLDRVVSGVWKG